MSRMMRQAGLGVLCLVSAYAVTRWVRAPGRPSVIAQDLPASPAGNAAHWTDVVLVYIGSSTCGWCRDERLPGAVKAVQDILADRVRGARVRLVSIGIDLDPTPGSELSHLRAIGRFNQMSVGGSWLSDASAKYLWGPMAGPAATPQLVVYARRFQTPKSSGEGYVLSFDRDVLLARKVGLVEILRWAKASVPLADIPGAPRTSGSGVPGRFPDPVN